jgi:hypothetical protein
VRLHGQRADDQALGDLSVGRSSGDQGEDLDLACGEIVRERCGGIAGVTAPLV